MLNETKQKKCTKSIGVVVIDGKQFQCSLRWVFTLYVKYPPKGSMRRAILSITDLLVSEKIFIILIQIKN